MAAGVTYATPVIRTMAAPPALTAQVTGKMMMGMGMGMGMGMLIIAPPPPSPTTSTAPWAKRPPG